MAADHPFIELRTPRLVLRRFRPTDAPAFQAYRADPDIARYQGWEDTYSLEEAETFMESVSRASPGTPGEWFQFAAISATTGHLLGDIGLRADAGAAGIFELGVTLAPTHQHHGYATEMAAAVISYAFTRLAATTIQAITDTRNTRSIRLLERLNFHLTETNEATFKGEPCEEHTYELLSPPA
ncbi:MAG: GNAT family N-acetyltransferase [Actinomycetota bacterium]